MSTPGRPIAVDLFAGAGGMTLGFEQAGFDVLAAVEIDPIHSATHEFNFPFWTTICRSVIDIRGEEIRDRAGIGDRDIDVVFGGPPCQGFSIIGKRAFDDPRNSLVLHFMRLVVELQPKYFVMENVKGLTIGNHKYFLAEVMEAFQASGYQVETSYKVLNAAHFGVPQDRQRLFLVGGRQGLPLPGYPLPITRTIKLPLAKVQELVHLPYCPTVGEAIADLPEIELYPELGDRDWCMAEFGKPSQYGSILRGLEVPEKFSDEVAADFSYPRSYNRRILTSSQRTNHSDRSTARFKATPPGRREPISHFDRLDAQSISVTLRAGTASNLGSFTSARPIHPVLPRCITVREAARLHSYPDWFRFHATKWHGFRQVGNSVPPRLARAIAAEIVRVLGIQPDRPNRLDGNCASDCPQQQPDTQLLNLTMTAAADYWEVDRHAIAPRLSHR